MRLNKYIAYSGLCSRRYADNLIRLGNIKINNKIVYSYKQLVYQNDIVSYNNHNIYPEKKIYIILNKPSGYITTTKDEKNRRTVMDIIKIYRNNRIYPIGRLDRKTTGVLLITNDGILTNKLLSPKYRIKKVYKIVLSNNLKRIDYEKIKNGIKLSEGIVFIDNIKYIRNNELILELHIGWNKVIRRIFDKLRYKIIKLDRISFAGICTNGLKRGDYRLLNRKEIQFLLR